MALMPKKDLLLRLVLLVKVVWEVLATMMDTHQIDPHMQMTIKDPLSHPLSNVKLIESRRK